jgi:hypothetical protein
MARKVSRKESFDLLDRVHLLRLEFMRRDPDYKRDYERLFPLRPAGERSDHVAFRKKYGLSRLEVMPPPYPAPMVGFTDMVPIGVGKPVGDPKPYHLDLRIVC